MGGMSAPQQSDFQQNPRGFGGRTDNFFGSAPPQQLPSGNPFGLAGRSIGDQFRNAFRNPGQQSGQQPNQQYQNLLPDPYTASRRPNYMAYGPNQQFYQPIYQPRYDMFSSYGSAPFGGFYESPMMNMAFNPYAQQPMGGMYGGGFQGGMYGGGSQGNLYGSGFQGFQNGGAVDGGIDSVLKK